MLKTFQRLPSNRQERILDAAARVFAKNGYDKANVDEICREAEISMGALYKYFKNKEALFLALMDHGVDLMVNELFGRYTEGCDSFFDTLEGLFDGVAKFARRYRPYVEIWVNLGACSMNQFAAYVSPRVETEGKKFYLTLLEEAREKGEIPADIRDDVAANFLDNHLCLLTYSLVSDYHRMRFDIFFGQGRKGASEKQKVKLILESAKAFFRT